MGPSHSPERYSMDIVVLKMYGDPRATCEITAANRAQWINATVWWMPVLRVGVWQVQRGDGLTAQPRAMSVALPSTSLSFGQSPPL